MLNRHPNLPDRAIRPYSSAACYFFGRLGKTPDNVDSREVFAYAHGPGPSGREPSSVTVGARIACVSSFYRFLIRMGIVQVNPCDQLERPRATEGAGGSRNPQAALRHPRHPSGSERQGHHPNTHGQEAGGGA